MKIHKFGNKQNTKGQIYRCKKLNQDICYTFLIIHDLKCPRICGHTVWFISKILTSTKLTDDLHTINNANPVQS